MPYLRAMHDAYAPTRSLASPAGETRSRKSLVGPTYISANGCSVAELRVLDHAPVMPVMKQRTSRDWGKGTKSTSEVERTSLAAKFGVHP
jgi:hypothetical protein